MVPVTSCENALFARVVVNSRLQHPALKFLEKADAVLKSKVDGSRTSSRGSMSAIKGKDPGRIVQDNPGFVENLNSKMKV